SARRCGPDTFSEVCGERRWIRWRRGPPKRGRGVGGNTHREIDGLCTGGFLSEGPFLSRTCRCAVPRDPCDECLAFRTGPPDKDDGVAVGLVGHPGNGREHRKAPAPPRRTGARRP